MSWAGWTEHFACQRNCMWAQNFLLTTLSSWGLGHVTTGASCPWIAMFLSLLLPLFFTIFNIHSYLLSCHFKFVLMCQNRTETVLVSMWHGDLRLPREPTWPFSFASQKHILDPYWVLQFFSLSAALLQMVAQKESCSPSCEGEWNKWTRMWHAENEPVWPSGKALGW